MRGLSPRAELHSRCACVSWHPQGAMRVAGRRRALPTPQHRAVVSYMASPPVRLAMDSMSRTLIIRPLPADHLPGPWSC